MSYLKERFEITNTLNKFKNKDLFMKMNDDEAREINYMDFDNFVHSIIDNTVENMKNLCINKIDSYLATIGEGLNVKVNEDSCNNKHLLLPKLEKFRTFSVKEFENCVHNVNKEHLKHENKNYEMIVINFCKKVVLRDYFNNIQSLEYKYLLDSLNQYI